MILYPTETIYALGVNALSEAELTKLFNFKGRPASKSVSWLVRDLSDIQRYAVVSEQAEKIVAEFLPGALTLVLPALDFVPLYATAPNHTIGFRISSDPFAEALIADFMTTFDAPLTCTSANVSGLEPESTITAILNQFGQEATLIDTVIDDGIRMGVASTVVGVLGDTICVYREGEITLADILAIL